MQNEKTPIFWIFFNPKINYNNHIKPETMQKKEILPKTQELKTLEEKLLVAVHKVLSDNNAVLTKKIEKVVSKSIKKIVKRNNKQIKKSLKKSSQNKHLKNRSNGVMA